MNCKPLVEVAKARDKVLNSNQKNMQIVGTKASRIVRVSEGKTGRTGYGIAVKGSEKAV